MALDALDYEAIKQLHARFAHTLDFGDVAGFLALFAPGATLAIAGDSYQGTDRLRQYVETTSALSAGHVRHTIAVSSLIDGDGNTARSLSYGSFTRDYGPAKSKGEPTKSRLLASGVYEDQLVKRDGRWLYASRLFSRDGRPDVLKRFGQPLDIAHVDAGATSAELTPLDCEAIRQLMTRYGYTLDFADIDGFVDCFTPDGYFELLTLGDPDFGGQARIEGAEALRQMVTSLGPRVLGHVRHGVMNSLIDGDGSRALVVSYGFFTTDHGTPPRSTEPDSFMMETSGIYRDEVVKVDGKWLFSARTFRYDGWPDVVGRLGQPVATGLFKFETA
jgi:ketosteroid isomerase-like protein